MYSAYVKLLSSSVEEMAESITDEESEYLREKYKGMPLQQILFESSTDEVLDYILHTKKQRETLKKYDPDTKRAELKFLACLHLEASLHMFQAFSAYGTATSSDKAMLEWAVRIHSETIHSELSSPLSYLSEKFAEAADFFDTLGLPYNPFKPRKTNSGHAVSNPVPGFFSVRSKKSDQK